MTSTRVGICAMVLLLLVDEISTVSRVDSSSCNSIVMVLFSKGNVYTFSKVSKPIKEITSICFPLSILLMVAIPSKFVVLPLVVFLIYTDAQTTIS